MRNHFAHLLDMVIGMAGVLLGAGTEAQTRLYGVVARHIGQLCYACFIMRWPVTPASRTVRAASVSPLSWLTDYRPCAHDHQLLQRLSWHALRSLRAVFVIQWQVLYLLHGYIIKR